VCFAELLGGRMIRVWGEDYGLCVFCPQMTRITQRRRE
jgi:hypothetical protein